MQKILFYFSLFLTLSCWGILINFYGLITHADSIHFAFDKVPGHLHSSQLQITTLVFLLVSLCYIFQCWYLKKHVAQAQRLVIVLSIVIYTCCVFALFIYPMGALDAYYYAASFKLFYFYGMNPYTVTFTAFPQDTFYQFTIAPFQLFPYGPLFLLLSGVPSFITGLENVQLTVIGLKTFNVLLLSGIGYLLYQYEPNKQKKHFSVFLFLANPLIIFEAIVNVHNDLMASFFLVLAVATLARRSLLSGSWFVFSFLTKIFTIALLPLFFYKLMHTLGIKKALLTFGGGLILAVVMIFPFWENGKMLAGILDGMRLTHTFYNVSLYSLVKDLIRVHPVLTPFIPLVQIGFIGLFLGVSYWIILQVRNGKPFVTGLLQTYLWFLILISIFYPWYLLPAFALIALNPTKKQLLLLFVLTIFGLLDYTLSVLFWFDLHLTPYVNHFIRSLFPYFTDFAISVE